MASIFLTRHRPKKGVQEAQINCAEESNICDQPQDEAADQEG